MPYFRGGSDRYSRCRNRVTVKASLSVGIGVTVRVSSDKVRVIEKGFFF